MDPATLYRQVCKWYALTPPFLCVACLFVDAPFGRFALKDSWFPLDGIKSWMVMELVSPISLIYALLRAPLNGDSFDTPLTFSIRDPASLLTYIYLIHYANRAIISPLRTPSRSKSHISVVGSAIFFNLINGSLMGTYLSSPSAQRFLSGAYSRPLFWVGLGFWAAGFAGNIAHDEILLNIRRRAKSKKSDDAKGEGKAEAGEHYAIPYGGLFRYISFPNYFCEWVEWTGFALAAAPIPAVLAQGLVAGLTNAAPPWLFMLSEPLLMAPRAFRGHRWYLNKFPEYPKDRKIVIPFIL